MHVAIVDGDVSYPATSGKRLRTLNLMLHLAKRHRLTYLARTSGSPQENREAEEFLSAHGIEPHLVHCPIPRKQGPLFYARLAANVASSLPYSVASHRSREMRAAVGAYAADHAVDLWQFEWSAYVETLPLGLPAPRVLMAHNVDSLIWRRYWEAEQRPLRRWYIKQQWRKFERFERRCFQSVSRVVACSHDDATLIAGRFGMPRVDVVENGIERHKYERLQADRDPLRVLFLGSLDWRPNLDALAMLSERIFPQVLARQPRARLVVVGRQPSAGLTRRMERLPFIDFHPDVPDVLPYLAECGMLAVPLRIGGGTRLKILEALAAGLPVVSTTIGAEGLDLVAGRDFVLADEADQFAAALLQTMEAHPRAVRRAEQARQLVLERYDWGAMAEKLDEVWRGCCAEVDANDRLRAGRALART